MKINNNILYIPPYISTSWNQIKTIYLKENNLIINLSNDHSIKIPDLSKEQIELIFSTHANFLENQAPAPHDHMPFLAVPRSKTPPFLNRSLLEGDGESSLTFGFGTFDSLGSALHHNENQSDIPNLPKEILSKISAIAKIVAPEDGQALPKPEPHCNCTHCQIARAVHEGFAETSDVSIRGLAQPEEVIKDTDLNFQQWDIQQIEEKLFSVTHKLDANEKYRVYLGHPVGCTCGKEGCEHILAVLKS